MPSRGLPPSTLRAPPLPCAAQFPTAWAPGRRLRPVPSHVTCHRIVGRPVPCELCAGSWGSGPRCGPSLWPRPRPWLLGCPVASQCRGASREKRDTQCLAVRPAAQALPRLAVRVCVLTTSFSHQNVPAPPLSVVSVRSASQWEFRQRPRCRDSGSATHRGKSPVCGDPTALRGALAMAPLCCLLCPQETAVEAADLGPKALCPGIEPGVPTNG